MTNAFDIAPEFVAPGGMKRFRDPRASTRAWVAFAVACLLHVGFVGLFIYDDLKSQSGASTAETTSDVDLVDESETTGKADHGDAGGEKTETPGGSEGAKSGQASASAEPSPTREPAETPRQPAAAPEAPEAAKPPPSDAPVPAGPTEPPPPPASGGAPNDAPAQAEQPTAATAGVGARPPPRLPTFAMPNLLGATQAPTLGTALSEEYKGVVYGMLERAKRDPDGPRPRPLSAVVTFDIDDAGNPRSVALARGSGRPDIDAEALALLRRAAPFPPPPPGVFRSFAPMIIFPAH